MLTHTVIIILIYLVCYQVVDREKKGVCDMLEVKHGRLLHFCWSNVTMFMQVGTIIRTLNIYPTERQLQRWIREIEEDEPTGFIMYEKFEALVLGTLRTLSSWSKL